MAAKIIALIVSLFVAAQPATYTLYIPIITQTIAVTKGVGATYSQCEYMNGVDWYYNWNYNPPECEGVENIPMLWGSGSVGKVVVEGPWLMGFNEPAYQSDISPYEAAVLWREIESLYPDKKLVSPSGLYTTWITKWYNEYQNLYFVPPKIDAVGVHCYGAWNAQSGISTCKSRIGQFIQWAKDRNIKEIWITEYGYLPCWPDGVSGSIVFMKEMQKHFENEPMITRHAWFQLSYKGTEPWGWGPACNTSLVDFYTGELTALGEAYD